MVSMRSRRPSIDPSISPEAASAAIGGAKTIGLVGGVALLINNITGSAMVLFPSLYQAAGWFVVTLALVAICALSYLCSIMIVEAMAFMPGNHNFTKRVEYTTLSYYYLGKRGYYFTQFFFQFSLACNNMSSIIQSVQVMDWAISAIAGKSCAIPEFYPSFRFHCPSSIAGELTPFGNVYLLSLGFIVTALVCLPLGFWNLDDNIVIQKVSCFMVTSMVVIWTGLFIFWGLDASRVPTIGTQFTSVLGVTVFNFAIITSIPSWVNEKKESVSILGTMGIAMPMALVLFTTIGIFGGMAFEPWFNTSNSDDTLLTKLQNSTSVLAKITYYIFPVVVNLTSIPVFAIMQRYNLLEAKVCSKKWANFFGVVLPWLVCIPFYTGSGFSNVVNWGGIVFNSTVNFIIPPLIYISMVRKQNAKDSLFHNHLEANKSRLKLNHIQSSDHHDAENQSETSRNNNQHQQKAKYASIMVKPTASTSLLGAKHSASASLNQSLLNAEEHYDSLHAHVDMRSEEEEEKDRELLGYDPVEAERIEEDELERIALAKARQEAISRGIGQDSASPPSGHQFGDSLSVPHPPVYGGSRALEVPVADSTVPGVGEIAATLNVSEDAARMLRSNSESSSFLFHQVVGWNVMPQWVVPYRIHLAASVAVVLTIIALAVVGINIQQCVTSGC